MSPAELNTEKKQHHRGKDQAEEQEGISFEIKEVLAKYREHLRGTKLTVSLASCAVRAGALFLTRWRHAFAEFFS